MRLILPGRRINIPVLRSQHGRSRSGVWTFISSNWTYILGRWGSTYSSYFCAMPGPSLCSVIAISSACRPHSSIHGSSLLECFGFSFRLCLPRARSEIHSLLFALLSPLFLPRFLGIYPLQSDFLFLCALSFPLYASFPHGLSCTYDFDPLLLLSIPLFLAFHCFCLIL